MKKGNRKIVGLAVIIALFSSVALVASLSDPAQAGGKNSRGKLNDRMEIAQLTTTYAWAVDSKDIDALMSIFVEGEPGVDKVYPIYDISALQIPGLDRVEGTAAIKEFLEFAVFAGEPWSFSSISNVNIVFTGKNTAEGGDYYIHEGFVPAELDGDEVSRTYFQFDPSTYDLLCDPDILVRRVKTGQHLYEFIKHGGNGWKIRVMSSSPTFSGADEIISIDQISPAKKPWHPMFDAMAVCN